MTATTTKRKEDFVHVASSIDGSKHSVGIDSSGKVFTWGRSNEMGQLARGGNSKDKCQVPSPVQSLCNVKAVRGFAGGDSESGHTAVLDVDGKLWLAGCDRWQQLGLGSSEGGASGYTWQNGRIWRDFFTRNDFLDDYMRKKDSGSIRDVALGGDHTIVLSSNKKDVIVFGKGGDGQLGLVGKPFVSAPVQSTALSSAKPEVAAVCAIQMCSITLDEAGNVLRKAGRCSRHKGEEVRLAIAKCIERAKRDDLIKTTKPTV